MSRLWPTPMVLGGAALAAFVVNGGTINRATSRITVSGSRDRIVQFAQRERLRHPAVGVSSALIDTRSTAHAIVTLPTTADGKELVTTMREVLDAGLSYRIEMRRESLQPRWHQ